MATLYVAFCAGGSSPLPALPIQYADFAHWQRQWLQGDVLETQIAYWKEQLAGAPALIDLPADHPRPAVQTFRGAHQSLVLPKHLQEGLKALSRQEGVTQFMTLLAAFKVLLYRYTGQDDLIVGTPIANRNRLETEGLIGFFVNALVLRTDLSGNPRFREFLRRVREVCLGAYAHQDLPFDRLVEELHVTRDLSRNPLFQVMFVLHNASLRAVELAGLTLSPVEGDSETAHFDLTLQIVDTEQELTAAFVYNTDLFEAGTIARMLGNFQTLLEAIVADPEQRLSDLPLLTETERQQLLVEWNGTKTDDPRDLCVHRLFEAQVERTPDAIAVVFETEQLTYAELNRRANQLAHHLRALGVGPEVPVAICLERSLEMVIGLLGILKAGGAYMPLDPAYPKERLAFMLKDAQAPVLLTRERLAAALAEQDAKVICLDSDWETIAGESGENPDGPTRPEDLAYVIYTSGSTGQPKGVLVSHGAIAGHCRNVQRWYELDTGDVVLQFASSSFDVSLEEILPTLIVGARLVVMGTNVWPPAEFHRKISEFGLTVLNLPTAYWQELAREWADVPELVPNIQPRLFIVGGDAMLPDALKLWRRTPANSIRLLNAYGPTETTITATAYEVAHGHGEHTTESSRAHRSSPRQPRDLHSGPTRQSRSDRRSRSSAYRRRRPGARVFEPARLDRRDVYSGPLQRRARSTNVQDRRSGPLSARWEHRVPRSRRPSGEDPRVSHRTGRNRGRAWPAPGRAGVRWSWRGKTRRARSGWWPMRWRTLRPMSCVAFSRTSCPTYMVPAVIVLLDALPLAAQREGGPPGAAGAGSIPAGVGEGVRRAARRAGDASSRGSGRRFWAFGRSG